VVSCFRWPSPANLLVSRTIHEHPFFPTPTSCDGLLCSYDHLSHDIRNQQTTCELLRCITRSHHHRLAYVRHFRLHVSVDIHLPCCQNADSNPTHSLYILSLYENNPIHILPSLFENDYSSLTGVLFSFLLRFALYSGSVVICIYWIKLWVFVFVISMESPILLEFVPTFIDGPHNMTITALGGFAALISLLSGVLALLVILWPLKDTVPPKLMAPFVHLRRLFFHRLGGFIKPFTRTGEEGNTKITWGMDLLFPCRFCMLNFIDQALVSIRIFMHLLIRIILIGATLTFSLFWFGFTIRLGLSFNVAHEGKVKIIFLSGGSAFFGLACLWPVIYFGRQLVKPFRS